MLAGWVALLLAGAYAQGTNQVIRSTNSVDIQICIQTAFLTPQRDVFQQTLSAYIMQNILSSNALYLDRQYTTNQSVLCYLYVYQGSSPSNAVSVLQRLAQRSTLQIPFAGSAIDCAVTAAQWSGDDLSYLGAPFPQLWTVNDLVLWGSCMLAVLILCMSGICIFALCKLRGHENSGALLKLRPPEAAPKVNLEIKP